MARDFFISDIHGHYKPFVKLLEIAKFDERKDRLVVGGDMIDRGPDSAEVLRFVHELTETYPNTIVALRGNHEDMMGNYFRKEDDMWLHHGQEAIQSFQQELTDPVEFDKLIHWAINLPTIIQDIDYVYVHAGINPNRETQIDEEMIWMPYDGHARTRFSDYTPEAILKWTQGRKVIHGHTPKSYIYDNGASICCDLGSGTTNTAKLALVDLTNHMYYYYDFFEDTYKQRAIAQKKDTSSNKKIQS